jgi:miniconductance mechanosensitive channel
VDRPVHLLKHELAGIGLGGVPGTALAWCAAFLGLVLVAVLAYLFCRVIVGRLVAFVVHRTETRWDDALRERRLFRRLAHLGPALVLYAGSNLLPPADQLLQRAAIVYFMAIGALAAVSVLDAAVDVYQTYAVSKHRPIKGVVEVAKIVILLFVGVLALAEILDRSPWLLLSGLGAMTAVLLVIFKDTLLGFVAGVQLAVNDMVSIGDWIEMPQFGADGDVVDITLHTVKVQNFDKTITTIPSYALVSDSFKNWRGMAAAGGRRIKRAVLIDVSSVRFCTPELLGRFEKLREHATAPADGRPPTNLGAFRAYVEAFLRAEPRVHGGMTLLVRELEPGPNGLPLEVYCFSAATDWDAYEALSADVVDHVIAAAPGFGLRVFQAVAGSDLARGADGAAKR